MKRDVAVIMSVYKSDCPDKFKEAVSSVLYQSYVCDLYIYQDGEIPKRLKSEVDKISELANVYIFSSNVNKGLAHGLNYLIDKSLRRNYMYVARMDSDDISHATRIERQVNYFELNPEVDVLGTSCKEFGAPYALEEKHLPKDHKSLCSYSVTRCPFIHPTVMFRSRVFERGFRYPQNTTLTEDMALWFELLKAGFIFGNINEVLLDYRLNESTLSRRRGIKKALSEFNIRFKYMVSLNEVSARNIFLIASRIFFHLLPPRALKFAYSKLR
ncbi:glycosyltransferase [Vibrio alginolyticus]|nr:MULTISPECIES: glycosyltransferase [Vibrio]MBO0177668.1 glycosyltransferase [Vibrio parahaemolyticus]MBO0182750.1 glycosyltransferase [Vibrio parahaemolyticus]MBO0203748.1 glycosyltransferase [Vibrio alginolyticus]MBS9998176.1 glycosyltransferase [Vibrio alginolyticus]MDF4288166.1 glycosyltransferase [Vibrio parahaemolyticus]